MLLQPGGVSGFGGCRVLLQPSVEELVLATGAWLGPGVCFVQPALYKCRSHNHVVRVVVPPQRVVMIVIVFVIVIVMMW